MLSELTSVYLVLVKKAMCRVQCVASVTILRNVLCFSLKLLTINALPYAIHVVSHSPLCCPLTRNKDTRNGDA